MKVYVIQQTWIDPESEEAKSRIEGAYDSIEKAKIALKQCYDSDIYWASEHDVFPKDNIESETSDFQTLYSNELNDRFSYISWDYDDIYSFNEIITLDLQ